MKVESGGELGNILGVWAHPDDEAYLSAGLMASAVAAGRRVSCVTATRGEAGFPADHPGSVAERMAVREREMAASLAVLGVTEHRWLGYADGHCALVPDDQAAATVAAVIDELRPDTVLTFGPDGGTGHPDHVAACRWATLAVDRLSLPGVRLLYSTKSRPWVASYLPDDIRQRVLMVRDFTPQVWETADLAVWFSCDDALLTRKVAALRAQSSQVEDFVMTMGVEYFAAMVREEFFRDRRPDDAEYLRYVAGLPSR